LKYFSIALIALGLPNSGALSDFIIGTATVSYSEKSISETDKESIFGKSFTAVVNSDARKSDT
jgi:hypothetical protein